MPTPAFAVSGSGQEPVHDFLVGIGGLVRLEGVQFGGGRRQPGQIKRDTTQQCGFIGETRRNKRSLLMFGGDERIEGILSPFSIMHDGHSRLLDDLKCPMVSRIGFGLFIAGAFAP